MIRDWNLDGKTNWVDRAMEYEAFCQTMYGTSDDFGGKELDADVEDFWEDVSDDDF